MSSGVVSTLVTGLMPLLGAGLGASATLLVQRNSAREAKLEFLAESRLAHREELKSAILDYFATAQDYRESSMSESEAALRTT
ncbi:hypothetical protein ACIBG0_19705 [Nocardia sp. NPDC050630]|uniref:hypothetical protein n=1 Tax=Nocardia sp. NPDC050630 TaxID=3364321 RepID=UPI00379F1CEF